MSLYHRYVFPWLCHMAMAEERFVPLRREVLSGVQGAVLELGFGTGLNLPHYPEEAVASLTAVDPNPGMHRLARHRTGEAPFPVKLDLEGAEELPYEDATFDAVVSTWTLCSIAAVEAALAEVDRVLRPGGSFLFLEHGASHEHGVRRWQRRLTPIQKRIADGCHLDRDIEILVSDTGLTLERCDRFYLPRTPKILGYLYRGVAVKTK